MQPLAIVTVLVFLGLLSVAGACLIVIGSRGMGRLTTGAVGEHRVHILLPTNALLITLGIAVMGLGVRGLYRIIWAG